jgi:glutamate synthase domain-containing protein 3
MTQVDIDAKGQDLKMVNTKIKEVIEKDEAVLVKNADQCFGLASGLRKGTITVEGPVNDYVATVNSGADLTVKGDTGKFLGDNMISGRISVQGSTEYGAGMYCYGGNLYIKGNAGDFTSTMNKGATIVIGGNVGHDVGTYMTAGDLVILGDAGSNLGNFIIRGAIYLGGKAETLGNNMKEVPMTKEDIQRFNAIFKTEGFDGDASKLKKYVPETDKPFYKAKKSLIDEEGASCR